MLLAAAGSGVLLVSIDRVPAPWLVAGLGFAAALAIAAVIPREPPAAHVSRSEVLLGALFGAGIALFFRLRYLRAVPIGFGPEPLNFLTFAQTLLDRHFPYVPYAWYAHTFYSYAIAFTMLFVHPPILAFRVASAAVSLVTVAALWFCLRELLGERAAWLGAALLAISDWHLFASRDGLHQFFLPLFQLLFLGGLARGLRTGRVGGFVIAAVSLVLGLHSHWGFYLMLPVTFLILVYIAVWQRELWRRSWKRLALMTALSAVLLVPLVVFYARDTNVFKYVLGAFSPSVTGRPESLGPGLSSKLIGNLRFVLWSLSGNPRARFHAEYAPATDLLVASLAFLGLAVSVRRFRVSLGYAAPVLLLAVNVGGLMSSIAGVFYMIATMAAVYCLAAVGAQAVLDGWEGLGRRTAAVALVLFAAVVGWQGRLNYRRFFDDRIFTHLISPTRMPFYTVFDRVLEASRAGRVYLPRREPSADFEMMAFQLADALPEYRAFGETLPFQTDTIVFPPAPAGVAPGVSVFLPASIFAEKVALPQFRLFYPEIRERAVYPPEPYRRANSVPTAYELEVPGGGAMRYQGLAAAKGAGSDGSREGFFLAPRDGRYEFRFGNQREGTLTLDGVVVSSGSGDAEPGRGVLLERGLHTLKVGAPGVGGDSAIQWRSGTDWKDLASNALQTGGLDPAAFAPYLARSGSQWTMTYRRRLSLAVPPPINEALLAEDGSMAAVNNETVTFFDSAGRQTRVVALPAPGPYRLARLKGRWVIVAGDGRHYQDLQDHLEPLSIPPCPVRDVVSDRDRYWVLCAPGQILEVGHGAAPIDLTEDGKPMPVPPASFARVPGGFLILDTWRAELLFANEEGKLRLERMVPGAFHSSNLASDDEGRISWEPFDELRRIYSPRGELLFAADTTLNLFAGEKDEPLPVGFTHRVRFRGDSAISVDRHSKDKFYVWTRERAPAPGSDSPR
jgi:hypothetical protein